MDGKERKNSKKTKIDCMKGSIRYEKERKERRKEGR